MPNPHYQYYPDQAIYIISQHWTESDGSTSELPMELARYDTIEDVARFMYNYFQSCIDNLEAKLIAKYDLHEVISTSIFRDSILHEYNWHYKRPTKLTRREVDTLEDLYLQRRVYE